MVLTDASLAWYESEADAESGSKPRGDVLLAAVKQPRLNKDGTITLLLRSGSDIVLRGVVDADEDEASDGSAENGSKAWHHALLAAKGVVLPGKTASPRTMPVITPTNLDSKRDDAPAQGGGDATAEEKSTHSPRSVILSPRRAVRIVWWFVDSILHLEMALISCMRESVE